MVLENFNFEIIKYYDVVDTKHLRSKEQLWINKLKSINELSAFGITGLSDKHYYNTIGHQKSNQYKKDNAEKIKEKNKEKEYCNDCEEWINIMHRQRHFRSETHLNVEKRQRLKQLKEMKESINDEGKVYCKKCDEWTSKSTCIVIHSQKHINKIY